MELENVSAGAKRLKGIGLLAATAVLWSTSGIGIKWIAWNPMAIGGIRSGIAALVIWAVFRQYPLTYSRASLLGGAAYAATMLTFVVANKMTTAANVILLQYTCPVYVAILSAVFLKEKPNWLDWLTMAMVGGGMLLFFQEQMAPGGLGGNLLAIASGVCMAIMIVCLRFQKDGSPAGSVLLGNILTFLCGLPFVFDGGPGLAGWAVLTLLGVVQIGFSYVLYTIAIKYVTALEASIVTIIEPLLNPVWVFLIMGEKPGNWALIGGAVIILAITGRYVLPALKSAGPVRQTE